MLRLKDPDIWFLVAREVKRGRNARGLRQQDLAELVSVDQSVIAKDERGQRAIPLERLQLYVDHLGLDEPYLQSILDGKATFDDPELDELIEAVMVLPHLTERERTAIARYCRDVRLQKGRPSLHLTMPTVETTPPATRSTRGTRKGSRSA